MRLQQIQAVVSKALNINQKKILMRPTVSRKIITLFLWYVLTLLGLKSLNNELSVEVLIIYFYL